MQYQLRTEVMEELNMLKNALREAEYNGEISHSERCKVMGLIGQIKTVLYSDLVFKQLYSKQEHSQYLYK